MAQLLLSEFKNQKRHSRVFKYSNGQGYVVELLEDQEVKESQQFTQQQQAEDSAEDWCLNEVISKKPKKA
jgi:hypothetical protein